MEIQEEAIDVPFPAVPVDIDELQKFVKKKLDKVPGEPLKPRPVTIFRLPAWFHEINKDLCEPKIVSIGPYHHGKESLQAMEEHKWSTLRDFLARNDKVCFEDYFKEMRLLEAQARECYSENVKLGRNDFVMMLLLDGCFILEYLLKFQKGQLDTILDSAWNGDIVSDFCLLENQLPFFVIHKLFAIQSRCYHNCQGRCPLLELIYGVMHVELEMLRFRPPKISCSEIHHLLHLYYRGILPHIELGCMHRDVATSKLYLCGIQIPSWCKRFSKLSNSDTNSAKSTNDKSRGTDQVNIPCATELHEAGVKFRRKGSPSGMFDISFQNGIMEMPHLQIEPIANSILWSMAALEQSKSYEFDKCIVSSYLGLMDSLINTEKDVAILERSGIIENFLQNDEEVAIFFNQFGKFFGLDYSNHYFHGLYKDVNKYRESPWHKYRARLMHDYFSDPWSFISVVAATVLLILTFLQTYYSAAK